MTHLQKLDFSGVNISSTVPYILTNLSSLTFLNLRFCSLHREFLAGIFKLSNLRFLSVYGNEGLTCYLPSFTWSSSLERLKLSFTSFSGVLPASMGNLGFLTTLLMSDCNFSGSFPSSLGSLTKLITLYLSSNAFVGNVPTSLGNLVQLFDLDISNNQLTGPVPSSIVNLPQLYLVDLSYNLSNAGLDLSANKLHGQISNSVFKLKNLEFLDLSNNYLTSINLTTLDIFSNQLSEFPNFLRNQHELKYLNLSNNKIHGHFPEWMWSTSTTSLKFLDLSNNFLTVFGQHPIFPPWTRLQVLDLWFNLLQGSLPIPPVSTLHFYISNNSLNGNIPFSFCNLSSLQVLDLANNNLSGSLPRCLDNFGAFSIST
ncbi:receptor-like protein 7 [Corylus avellana]|uniref:receptor-like protein 7 n=1 Tax=Corylus avellana TaxID=13451 RepID=UPI00286C9C90|nr:receptor-like protein 7 [Corylus avellana]